MGRWSNSGSASFRTTSNHNGEGESKPLALTCSLFAISFSIRSMKSYIAGPTARIHFQAVLLLSFNYCTGFCDSVVTRWNSSALDAIRADKTAPPIASRNLAIAHIAIYDAVNGMGREYENYLVPSAIPASASMEAAASAAAYRALSMLFPAAGPSFSALRAEILATIPEGPRKTAALIWGESVAEQCVASRANDGANTVVEPPAASGQGSWFPTPPGFLNYVLPQWGNLTPFTMMDHAQFRPPGPPALDSAKWAADYNEVKAMGAAEGSLRTPEQDQIALFWADGSGTETPPGHWNTIARGISVRFGYSIEEDARLFALLNMAMADAAICAWDAKYNYNFWRPVTAIRNGDLDGNPDTDPDPAWSSFIITPPFPDYVSGHSTFSGAASTVLALFCGTDNVSFTTGSDFLPGAFRTFNSFSAAADEAAISRLYGGIHFRSANEDGLEAGLKIGEWTFEHFLKAKGNRSRK
jgi:hypothetical protein